MTFLEHRNHVQYGGHRNEFQPAPNLEQFVRDRVESGDYNNAGEVAREAIRMLKCVEERRASKPCYGTIEKPHKKVCKAAIFEVLLEIENLIT